MESKMRKRSQWNGVSVKDPSCSPSPVLKVPDCVYYGEKNAWHLLVLENSNDFTFLFKNLNKLKKTLKEEHFINQNWISQNISVLHDCVNMEGRKTVISKYNLIALNCFLINFHEQALFF